MLVITRGYSIQYSHAKDAYDHLPKLGCPNSPAADPAFLSRWPPHVKKNRNPPVMAIPNMYPLRIFSKGHIFYIYIFISYVIIYTYISYNHMCIYICTYIYSIQYCLNLGIEAICIHFPCCGLKIASIPSTFQAQKSPKKWSPSPPIPKVMYHTGNVTHLQ